MFVFSYLNLYDRVFDNTVDAEELIIITGYIGPPIIADLDNLPYHVKIYVGMYGNHVNGNIHNSLLDYNKKSNIDIFYTNFPVHSKCYIWIKDGRIVKSLIGSANFSTGGLRTPYKEVLSDIPQRNFDELFVYKEMIRNESYLVSNYSGNITSISFVDEFTRTVSENEVSISLLASRDGGSDNLIGERTVAGDVHKAAGLNWGFSNGLPLPNDAYIKIPSQQVQESPLLFPPKKDGINEYIDVVWDDGTQMQMLLEGTQIIDGVQYPKQISTYKSKKELGLYLRKRIGEKIGKDLIIPVETKDEFVQNVNMYKDKLITKEMLEKYGRNNINIKLIGEGTYFFDFSPKLGDNNE